jgi:hypothetical protein
MLVGFAPLSRFPRSTMVLLPWLVPALVFALVSADAALRAVSVRLDLAPRLPPE